MTFISPIFNKINIQNVQFRANPNTVNYHAEQNLRKDSFNSNPLYDNFVDKNKLTQLAKSNPEIMRILKENKIPLKINVKELEDLNLDSNWRKILGKKEPDNRFLDIELLLRLLVFYKKYNKKTYSLTGYNNMRLFLDDFISENVDLSIDNFKNIFQRTCDLVVTELGNTPFHFKGTRPNYIILDSIMGGILILEGNVINLNKKFKSISQKHKDYYENKSGTLSKTRVEERLEFSIKELKNE